jgi:peptidoglycan/xylan/chitin deacetylase (PgdA/CDA1 family)
VATANKQSEIAILTYHSIDRSGSVISVSPEMFETHLKYLKKLKYTPISLSRAIDSIKNNESFPEKGVIITFDDGYKNNYTEALAILTRYGYTATIFLVTGLIGGGNDWPGQNSTIPQLEMLTWPEVREMQKNGIEFGAHTHNHVRLSEVHIDEAREEILHSKNVMEENLGSAAELFCYPFGSYTEAVKDFVASNFKGAMATHPGKLSPDIDLYAIKRINASGKMFKVLPVSIAGICSFNFYLYLKAVLDKISKWM